VGKARQGKARQGKNIQAAGGNVEMKPRFRLPMRMAAGALTNDLMHKWSKRCAKSSVTSSRTRAFRILTRARFPVFSFAALFFSAAFSTATLSHSVQMSFQ